jgi:uncharacterized protein YbcC (UPF0753/DUF2309 family)
MASQTATFQELKSGSMQTVFEPVATDLHSELNDAVREGCRRIPPLWPLKNFVAVNPFVGLSDGHFIEAAALTRRVGHGDTLMPAEYYLEAIEAGRITEHDFTLAADWAAKTLPPRWAEQMDYSSLAGLQRALRDSIAAPSSVRVLTFAEFLDTQQNRQWATLVVEEVSKWCSAYYDQGQSSWRMPWRHLSLFAAWQAAARLDANPELSGLKHFRQFVGSLSSSPAKVIERALSALGVPEHARADFLHRQLMSISGWSSHVQFHVREAAMAGKGDDSLEHLLAIRLAYDLALLNQFGAGAELARSWRDQLTAQAEAMHTLAPDLLTRYLAQQALECGYQRSLVSVLQAKGGGPTATSTGRPTLQAVFCIDVRSEVFRWSLEVQSVEIETIGFAGFFGMPIEYLRFGHAAGSARCPVLLTPKLKVRERMQTARAGVEAAQLRRLDVKRTVAGAWNAFKTSAISCFSFVEAAGLWFGVKLIKDSLGLGAPATSYAAPGGRGQPGPRIEREVCCAEHHGQDIETGMLLADQVALAAGALRNMGLTSNFAPVVLLCGHGSATTNNPYGSALDCGACGGHAGDANARIAAAILNNPAVREELKQQAIEIPEDTVFVAGLHNTTTDEILLYDTPRLSAGQAKALVQVRGWLSGATRLARRERAAALGLSGLSEVELDAAVLARSCDWAQVRPEWGLAGNAAFIAAPRERTKGCDLGGRTFLHNYASSRDADGAVLELIMTAPMVVGSWINLQYYGSTVNNRLFGSGNKVTHNVVGTFGVWQGNGGDLQTGLPLQSLHDGSRWRHEPLRLSVVLEASREQVEAILERHATVAELVNNGWIHLFALEVAEGKTWKYLHRSNWADFTAHA